MTLLDDLRLNLAESLIRKASTTCSVWSSNYVCLGKPVAGPLRFNKHPWSKEMHDEDGDWVGMKAAQMAFTQTALDRALFVIDVKKVSVLYLLPKKTPDAIDFSRSKFDALLQLSPYIASIFSNVRNVGHKQAGGVDFFLRGARSRSGAKSVSTGVIVFDEFDEMLQRNIALASERSSGFETGEKQTIKLSTPTIPDFGIAREYDNSDQEHYFFNCPRCSQKTEFLYPDCLVITADSLSDKVGIKKSYLICPICKGRIEAAEREYILNYQRAGWESTANRNCGVRGFQINQMYSTVMQPWEIATQVLRAKEDSNYEQELWNSKLGLPYVQKGARIEDVHLNACLSQYNSNAPAPRGQLITMGVDVGHHELYYEITQWMLPPTLGPQINLTAVGKVLCAGVVNEYVQLDRLMNDYQVLHCVIDVFPYYRDGLTFAMRFPGRVNMCMFTRGVDKNGIKPQSSDFIVHVNRTSWLDLSQGRFKRARLPGGILLPSDIQESYRAHVKALTKVTSVDDDGNLQSKYISVGPDHFAFAHVYNEIALPLAVSNRTNQNITAFL